MRILLRSSMKKFLLTVAFALCPAAALFGQTFTGAWQGTLKIPRPPGELRIVLEITAAEKGALQAEGFSIDQGGRSFRYISVTQSGTTIRMTLAGPNGIQEGKLSPDGNTLTVTGDWDLGTPTPLILTKATAETAWTIPEPPPPPTVMDPKAKPEFEVATIKPSDPNQTLSAYSVNDSGMLITHNLTVVDLIKFAYNVNPRQISGAPAWAEFDKFDITAKPDKPGIPNGDQLAPMVQKLLADRFGLVIRREKKELSAYVITVAKGGPKIAKAEPSPITLAGFSGRPSLGVSVRNATMAQFAANLQSRLDGPVVDQTGLGDQRYNFVLKWTVDAALLNQNLGGAPPPNAPQLSDADRPPDLFTAMQQQLGLQMKSGKALVGVLVIDKVEKPSAN
jgi:uncharacterized protein (TIGR03435 family)